MQPFSHDEDLTSDPTSAMVVVDDTTAPAEDSRGRGEDLRDVWVDSSIMRNAMPTSG